MCEEKIKAEPWKSLYVVIIIAVLDYHVTKSKFAHLATSDRITIYIIIITNNGRESRLINVFISFSDFMMVWRWSTKSLLTFFLLGVLLSGRGRASEDDEEVSITEEVVVSE